VLYDDRDIGSGEKFSSSDLIGLPYRIVVSEKNLKNKTLEIKQRNKSKPEFVKYSNIYSLKKYFK
jgi:prolyl-tRNA synthetase